MRCLAFISLHIGAYMDGISACMLYVYKRLRCASGMIQMPKPYLAARVLLILYMLHQFPSPRSVFGWVLTVVRACSSGMHWHAKHNGGTPFLRFVSEDEMSDENRMYGFTRADGTSEWLRRVERDTIDKASKPQGCTTEINYGLYSYTVILHFITI